MNNIKEIETNLEVTVRFLSEEIGSRSYKDLEELERSADYIEEKMVSSGCDVKRQSFTYMGNTYHNIIGEVSPVRKDISNGVRGDKESETLIIGAHYDTVPGTPGADDNASGIAGLLELARLAALKPSPRTVRFVAFTLEEPPLFKTRHMGSYMYAKSLKKEKVKVEGMISLEMIGYFCERKGCQYYPFPFFKLFYPEKGDFIAFVGNISSRAFTKRVKNAFQKASTLPVESLNTVSIVPGVDFSDHSSFWSFGYPAFMITDTAFYRNPNYHTAGDRAHTLDYKTMALLIYGLKSALIP
ncbi:MAG: M28 family peptidase [Thermodesulfovibrionales bacterium]|nr:M28 family peptidase [Thermodesulfovibrionales bacterium]